MAYTTFARVGGPNGRAVTQSDLAAEAQVYFLRVDHAKAIRAGRFGEARGLETELSAHGEENATEAGRYA